MIFLCLLEYVFLDILDAESKALPGIQSESKAGLGNYLKDKSKKRVGIELGQNTCLAHVTL